MISWNFSYLLLCAVIYYLGFPRVNLYYMIFFIFLHLPWGSPEKLGWPWSQKKGSLY